MTSHFFGKFLKRIREARGLTLRDVETKVGVSNAYLSQIEQGKRSIPSIKILNKLSLAYGIPSSILLKKAEEKMNANLIPDALALIPSLEFIIREYQDFTEEEKKEFLIFFNYICKKKNEKPY